MQILIFALIIKNKNPVTFRCIEDTITTTNQANKE